ncbi:MAG: diacylglycerol kinase family lipid kinase [Candidatus Marinimicrobia bacterium]|nr:diacylglycerol kinase family lipid kinase [Candidatus Neomarinimicrobiota bacterium]
MDHSNSKHTFIICNPTAGEGLAAKRWLKFKEKLETGKHKFSYKLTESPDHATEIAKDLIRDGYKRIAVFGGDGTLNETLQGLAQFGEQVTRELELLYFPAGSSCDFARKFPDGHSMLDRFLSTETLTIDICRVDCKTNNGEDTSRFFINNSSIGIISAANDKYNNVTGFSKFMKRVSVDFAAIMAGISAIREFQPYDCNLKVDGKSRHGQQMSNITMFKTSYFGGGMNYGIDCIQDSGEMDVVLVDSLSRLKLLATMPALYTGTALNNEAAHHWTCSNLEIKSNPDVCIETDGEIAGYPPATYTVLKKAIRVVV